MHTSITLAATALLALSAGSALAQDNAVVCVDAKAERNVVVAADLPKNAPATSCPASSTEAYLVQGRRNQLRVVNRKFLSDYNFTIDGVTTLPQVRIEDLAEASSLTIPLSSASTAVSKGAAPKGLVVAGALTLRTAQDILGELSNPAEIVE